MKNYKNYLDCARTVLREDIAEYADCAKERVGAVAAYSVGKAREFSLFDFAIFKLCLVSFGVWLGAQFSKLFGKLKPLIFAGFAATYAYLIWRIFFKQDHD